MKHIFLIVVIIFPGYGFAQLHASFSTGFAGFDMQDMKAHQLELKAQFPIDVKIMESFPAFWFYELSLTGEVTDRVSIGGAIGFMSTGGQMDYRDYSGEIKCKQLTRAWTAAARCDVLLNANTHTKWPVYFTGKLGTAIGRYDLEIFSELNNERDTDNVKFQSANLFIEPGVMIAKRIVGPLSANLSAGFNLNVIKGKQKLVDNNELFLQDNSRNKVSLDWSGYRLAAGLSVAF
ncbi:hypothetical protein [Chryseolinea soli]|uniref:Outer membrane protein beta-barrel domain-containing protein n=1 Tax=Chryseolinea soli TaxID=2321403 RepID=A0A385SPB4_9BACT|nr:hypothetical protein [Chryseolinea soli]AYB33583.1 hypothetical protein D4L85_24670 [Chryseolinea soli]